MNNGLMADGLLMKYFVLRPFGNDRHAIASRAAMRTYAQSMHGHNNQLSKDIKEWAEREAFSSELASADSLGE